MPRLVELSAKDLEALHARPHPILLEIEQHARKDGVPAVARETGRLLSTLVTAMQANRILEVGTAYGDATLWMALAQPRMGKIWTVESELQRTGIARSYFTRAGEDDYIEVFNRPAVELLENFPHHNLDIAFVSADQPAYARYLALVTPLLKLSGLAIFDRALRAPPEFVERFLHHPDLDATLLALGEGIAVGARRQ